MKDSDQIGPLWIHRLYIPVIWIVSMFYSASIVVLPTLEKPDDSTYPSNHLQNYTVDHLLNGSLFANQVSHHRI